MPFALLEAQKAYKRAWNKANRAKINAYSREYRSRDGNYETHLARCREYSVKNRDRILEQHRQRYATDEAYRRHKRLSNVTWLYGISREQYEGLLNAQLGVCACCRCPETRKNRKHLSVDHDHQTGKVRGLLCSDCNTALGSLREDPERLRALARYIEAHAKVP